MRMVCVGRAQPWLHCFTTVVSSLSDKPSVSLPPPQRRPRRNYVGRRIAKPKQPSVLEVERAIGAGVFKDHEVRDTSAGEKFFDLLSSSPVMQPEGSAEKKLREAGEWVLDHTEESSRSGQRILLVVCLYILPLWLVFFLIASGIVQLPFNIPVLDDWLM